MNGRQQFQMDAVQNAFFQIGVPGRAFRDSVFAADLELVAALDCHLHMERLAGPGKRRHVGHDGNPAIDMGGHFGQMRVVRPD